RLPAGTVPKWGGPQGGTEVTPEGTSEHPVLLRGDTVNPELHQACRREEASLRPARGACSEHLAGLCKLGASSHILDSSSPTHSRSDSAPPPGSLSGTAQCWPPAAPTKLRLPSTPALWASRVSVAPLALSPVPEHPNPLPLAFNHPQLGARVPSRPLHGPGRPSPAHPALRPPPAAFCRYSPPAVLCRDPHPHPSS
ncbi:hypothetical protein H8957_017063, partial [Semnopithecus entellus]